MPVFPFYDIESARPMIFAEVFAAAKKKKKATVNTDSILDNVSPLPKQKNPCLR